MTNKEQALRPEDASKLITLLSALRRAVSDLYSFSNAHSYSASEIFNSGYVMQSGFDAETSHRLNDASAMVHQSFVPPEFGVPSSLQNEEEFKRLTSELSDSFASHELAGLLTGLFERAKLVELKSYQARSQALSTSKTVEKLLAATR